MYTVTINHKKKRHSNLKMSDSNTEYEFDGDMLLQSDLYRLQFVSSPSSPSYLFSSTYVLRIVSATVLAIT